MIQCCASDGVGLSRRKHACADPPLEALLLSHSSIHHSASADGTPTRINRHGTSSPTEACSPFAV